MPPRRGVKEAVLPDVPAAKNTMKRYLSNANDSADQAKKAKDVENDDEADERETKRRSSGRVNAGKANANVVEEKTRPGRKVSAATTTTAAESSANANANAVSARDEERDDAAEAMVDDDEDQSQMLEVGYLSGCVDRPDRLKRRLAVVLEVFSAAEPFEEDSAQDATMFASIQPLAYELLALLTAKNLAVSRLASLALAHLVRICMPHSVFKIAGTGGSAARADLRKAETDNDSLGAMFDALIGKQLSRLGTASDREEQAQLLALLEVLSDSQAFFHLVRVDEADRSRARTVRLLNTLLNNLREAHGEKARGFVRNIFGDVILNMREVPCPVLDELFRWVIAPQREASPREARLVEEVMAAACEALEGPVAAFLGGMGRAESNLADLGGEVSNIGEKLDEIAIALYRIEPQLLRVALPAHSVELKSGDPDVRRRTVEVVVGMLRARLAAGGKVKLVLDEGGLVDDLLGRFRDADASVRTLMVARASFLHSVVEGDAHLSRKLLGAVLAAIEDPDEKVRAQAITRACRSASGFATEEVVRAVGGRLRDKSHAVRLAALAGLATLFRGMAREKKFSWIKGAWPSEFWNIPSKMLLSFPTSGSGIETDARARLWVQIRRCLVLRATAPAPSATATTGKQGLTSASNGAASAGSALNTSAEAALAIERERLLEDAAAAAAAGTADEDSAENLEGLGDANAGTEEEVAEDFVSIFTLVLSAEAQKAFLRTFEYGAATVIAAGKFAASIQGHTTLVMSPEKRESNIAAAATALAARLVNPPRAAEVLTKVGGAKKIADALAAIASPTATPQARTSAWTVH